jgi:hypothetical protein
MTLADILPAGLFETIAESSIALLVKEDLWAYPALETVHIIGLGLLFGSIVAFDLRVLGWHKDLPLATLGRHLLPWVWTGFALNATSGLLLFASDAVEFSANPALAVKLGLIAAAGANALLFQRRYTPAGSAWDRSVAAPAGARVSAALSIALWVTIVVAGRMIAYVK